MSFALEARNVSFGYAGAKSLFSSFDFALEKGGFTALLGPNGAGKTTILRMLSGYLAPSSGEILLSGLPAKSLPRKRRAGLLAVVPQNVFTPLPYTVREVVEIGRVSRLSAFGGLLPADRRAVEEAMDAMGVSTLADRVFTKLSGGERQRVMIAAALAQEAETLMLDEPSAHLDIGHACKLMRTLSKLNAERGITVFMISHDVQLAARFCHAVAVLKDGRIQAQGQPASILTESLVSAVYGERLSVFTDPKSRLPAIVPDIDFPL
jgi:iron complex transport system ATP-binding protein